MMNAHRIVDTFLAILANPQQAIIFHSEFNSYLTIAFGLISRVRTLIHKIHSPYYYYQPFKTRELQDHRRGATAFRPRPRGV
ncbi:hypothetical protein [Actinobaculum suis]|nr:hypothetical protein [Actinobaculum suis]